MKKALLMIFYNTILAGLFAFAGEDEARPIFQTSARISYRAVIEEPLRGFEAVVIRRLDDSVTNRFNAYWYLNALGNASDRNYAANQFNAAVAGGTGDAFRQYFVEDFATSLPIVVWFEDQIEAITSGKVVRFVLKTFAGGADENQITSPFGDRRLPLQAVNFTEHRINFGLRPFSDDNPSAFVGYTVRTGSEEILDLQCRVHLRDWSEPVPEIVVRVPLDGWFFGAGLRYESRSGFQSNDRTWGSEQGLTSGVSYFFGIQGPILGGWLFVSTGYPVPVTVLYSRGF